MTMTPYLHFHETFTLETNVTFSSPLITIRLTQHWTKNNNDKEENIRVVQPHWDHYGVTLSVAHTCAKRVGIALGSRYRDLGKQSMQK